MRHLLLKLRSFSGSSIKDFFLSHGRKKIIIMSSLSQLKPKNEVHQVGVMPVNACYVTITIQKEKEKKIFQQE